MAELTEEEGKKLIEAFNKFKLKPKADTPQDLELWLKAFSGVKAEPGVPTDGAMGGTSGGTAGGSSKETVVTTQQPSISCFFGDKVKGEASYAQWVYEVKCLLKEKTHKPDAIAQAVRRSLRGEASSIVRRLGIGATIEEILHKFDSVYGEVDTKEHLLAKFYSAKQEEGEDVTKWSCRLEDILSSAVERKLIDSKNVNEMLRNMFWQGLKPSLKDISGYKFEKIKDFDQLRVEIRQLEQDHLHPEANIPSCPVSKTSNKENNDLKEVKTMIQSFSSTVQQLEKKVNSNQASSQSFNSNRGRGKSRRRGNFSGTQETFYQNTDSNVQYRNDGFNIRRGGYKSNSQPQQTPRQYFNPRNQYSNYSNAGNNNCPATDQRQGQGPQFNTSYQNSNSQNMPQGSNQSQEQTEGVDESFNTGPLCFRCRLYDHFQWRCPVRMDHSRKYLN